jgi:tetratricopeptide (TPR) repeat protein
VIDELRRALGSAYRIETEIGHGGMARVFRAYDPRHDRTVAVKVLRPDILDPDAMSRFLDEIRTTAQLQHPHLLPVLDSGMAGSHVYYVMPFIESGTLRDRLESSGNLSEAEVAFLGAELADALDYVHRKGHIHRDVKPENILLASGHAYLGDFGISRALHHSQRKFLTNTGYAMGTTRYMSPEQSRNDPALDGRSDQYSLGVVLAECVGDSGSTPAADRARTPSDGRRVARRPSRLRAVLTRMHALAPVDRYPTAAAARDALRASGEGAPSKPPPALAAVGLAVAVALLAGLAFYVVRRAGPLAGSPAPVAASPARMVVLPFDVHGQASGADLEYGIPPLLVEALNGELATPCVDSRPVLEAMKAKRQSGATPKERSSIAARFDAQRFLAGDAVVVGRLVRLSARVRVAAAAESLLCSATAEGPVDSLASVVDRLAILLLAGLKLDSLHEDLRAGNPNRSLATIKDFLDGEAARPNDDMGTAARFYESALHADSTMALAWLRLGQVTAEVGEFARSRAALSPRGRELVKALTAFYSGQPEEAERAYRILVDRDPSDLEALRGLRRTLSYYDKLVGWDPEIGADIDRRIASLDPSDPAPLRMALDRSLLDRNVPRADSLLKALQRFHLPELDLAEFRINRLAALNRFPEAFESARKVAAENPGVVDTGPFLAFDEFDYAAKAFLWLDDPKQPPVDRLTGRMWSAWMEDAGGHGAGARAQLARARDLNPRFADIYEALMACRLDRRLTDNEYEHLRGVLLADTLSDEKFAGTVGGAQYLEVEGSWATTRLYAIGLLDAATGHRVQAEAQCAALARWTGEEVSKTWSRFYVIGIRARLLWEEHRYPEALDLLEHSTFSSQPGARIGLRTLTHERYLRIALLAEAGRDEEALRWTRFFGNPAFWFDKIYEVPKLMLRGRILQKLHRDAEARTEFEKVLRILDKADPEFAAVRDEARQRLGELAAATSAPGATPAKPAAGG